MASSICAAALLASCTAPTVSDAGTAVQRIELGASAFNAGEIGHAWLLERAQRTAVTLALSGVPGWVARPVHLYAYVQRGSCAATAAEPAYALTGRVLARRGGDGFLTLTNTLPVSLETLRAGDHALVVRSSPADADRPLFCGDLRPL
ncbi:MAG TPA: hypothetical protein VFU71_18250 [Burkholderiaceae bacterium]|nr:hypothetical protein [Burkholderiaceae bacterium]